MAIRHTALILLATASLLALAGCGGDDDSNLVVLDIDNLPQIMNPAFIYTAWVRADGSVSKLDSFNTLPDGTLRLSRFALVQTLDTGDDVFITIEPNPDPDPDIPTDTVVLTGTIQGDTAVLLFPELQGFANVSGFATVSGAGNRQLLTEFFNLPDVSDNNFIYQGWLNAGGNLIPLQTFNFNQAPVSDTVGFDLTTAQYFLSVEPLPDPDPGIPFSIRPLFTNGNLQELRRIPLVASSIVPDQPTFNYPSAVATIR